jgi:protein-L-isoaspartate(D-aspartate) O-methyltransferase
MLATDTYRLRLETTGLSYLELSYRPLQGYDFLHLYRTYGCILQLGGSDQWSNILAGVDLIRRAERAQVFGMVAPLLTTASGAKMGKTEAGAVWLAPDLTPPYDFYQFWINTADADVERLLAFYTFLPMDEIRELGRLEGAAIREAKEVLAFEVTKIVHGEAAAREARAASRALFSTAPGADEGAVEAVPSTTIEAARLRAGVPAVVLLGEVGLCRSHSEARRLIGQGGAYVNDQRIDTLDAVITLNHATDGQILLRAGKKRYHRVVVIEDPQDQERQEDASVLHQALVDKLRNEGHIRTPRVEAAFRAIPRHLFLPGMELDRVYRDDAIATKVSDGRAISSSSQPAIMAIMLEDLELKPGHRVLEIGAGTGYNAALMAHIVGEAGQVVTVDIDEDLVEGAREHLAAAGIDRVQVICSDGGFGYRDAAPYDRIILTVAASDIAPAWREQLKPDGRLLLPLSIKGTQACTAFEPVDDHLASVAVGPCGFMMLRGAFAGSTTIVQLGPEPGLGLSMADSNPVDADRVYQLLTSPSRDWPTLVRVLPFEIWGGLNLWLALHESGFCGLYAEGELAERGIVPYLFGPPDKFCGTVGLLDEASMCMLMRSPAEVSSPEQPDIPQPFDLAVRSFGPEERLAQRLIEQITAWDAAGRPSIKDLRIKVYPKDTDYAPSAHEAVVVNPWSQFVLDWGQS